MILMNMVTVLLPQHLASAACISISVKPLHVNVVFKMHHILRWGCDWGSSRNICTPSNAELIFISSDSEILYLYSNKNNKQEKLFFL